jgi:hypothetical protein
MLAEDASKREKEEEQERVSYLIYIIYKFVWLCEKKKCSLSFL